MAHFVKSRFWPSNSRKVCSLCGTWGAGGVPSWSHCAADLTSFVICTEVQAHAAWGEEGTTFIMQSGTNNSSNPGQGRFIVALWVLWLRGKGQERWRKGSGYIFLSLHHVPDTKKTLTYRHRPAFSYLYLWNPKGSENKGFGFLFVCLFSPALQQTHLMAKPNWGYRLCHFVLFGLTLLYPIFNHRNNIVLDYEEPHQTFGGMLYEINYVPSCFLMLEILNSKT